MMRLRMRRWKSCVPGPQWVQLFTDRDGGTYVDQTRLSLTDRSTVTCWVLVEYFNDKGDFYLGNYVLDCATGQAAPLQATMVNRGRLGPLRRSPFQWKDTRCPGQGTAVGRF